MPYRAPDPNEPREVAVVARGVIDCPEEGAEKEIAGYDTQGRQYTYRLPVRRYYPGEQITLPVSEIRRLQKLGVLRDPDSIAEVTSPLA